MDKQKNSTHISIWINNELLEECTSNQKLLNISTRGDYIEDALRFYNGYIHEKGSEKYISETVMKPMDKMVKRMENRIARAMFKQTVEICKIFWLMVKAYNIDPDDVNDFHEDCVEEVKRINGAIRFNSRRKDDEE